MVMISEQLKRELLIIVEFDEELLDPELFPLPDED